MIVPAAEASLMTRNLVNPVNRRNSGGFLDRRPLRVPVPSLVSVDVSR